MIFLAGYKIVDKIHEGNKSIIYRGIRNADQQPVTIKIPRKEYPSTDDLDRLRWEFEITRGLSGDGIITVYELEKHNNSLAMVSEDIGGDSIAKIRAVTHLDLTDKISLSIHITEKLEQIHRQNVIHKDINPRNIIWNPTTNEINIIDFGIATKLIREHSDIKNPIVVEGTLSYISPEQTGRINRTIDYRSDFYSLGITFYELFTGKLPFRGKDAMEMVHCHVAKIPPRPHELNPEVPLPISNIIMKLISKTAEERYQNIFALKQDLRTCLTRIKTKGEIDVFTVGLNDVSDKFKIPQKLYGRGTEVNSLINAFERVCKGAREVMLVAGQSGIGKTALVREIYKPITEKRGRYASGKFDQLKRNIPYSALIQAFRELANNILLEDEDNLSLWRQNILKAIGANGRVITDVIPELTIIIGEQSPVQALDPERAKERFDIVFRRFASVFAQQDAPLVIFLDDLQWADLPSLRLMENLIMDTDARYLFLIGAYRDNEVEASHPLKRTMGKLNKYGCTVNTITLTPLRFKHVHELISDTLLSGPDISHVIARTCIEKTGGNPFFLNQMLYSLYEDHIISFNYAQNIWHFDTTRIEDIAISDNILELLIKKIIKLPDNVQNLLKLASCVGNSFDLNSLAIISEYSRKNIARMISTASWEHLVIPTNTAWKRLPETMHKGNEYYKFSHDRIQQAAYGMIAPGTRKKIHLKAGRLLLKNTPKNELAEIIFDVVNHLNHGIECIEEATEKYNLAELNFLAGTRAKHSAAFMSAYSYMNTALALLGNNSWENHHDFTLQLHEEMLEACFVNNNYEALHELAKTVRENTEDPIHLAKVSDIELCAYTSQNQPLKAIEIGLNALQKLGVDLIKNPDIPTLANTLPRIEKLDTFPLMTDASKIAAVRLIKKVNAPMILAAPEMLPSSMSTLVKLCIDHGHSKWAAYAYVDFGILLCGAGLLSEGYHSGQIALALLAQFDAGDLKCEIYAPYNGFISHWNNHIKESLDMLMDGFHSGLETGIKDYTGYCLFHYCHHIFWIGKKLDWVSKEQLKYMGFMRKMELNFSLGFVGIMHQLTLNLQSMPSEQFGFTGDSFDEKTTLPKLIKSKNGMLLFSYHLAKMIQAYFFMNFSSAVESGDAAFEFNDSMLGSVLTVAHNFYYSLAMLARYEDAGPSKKEQYLEQVAKNQEKLQLWKQKAPMNYEHKFFLVEAEKARVLKKHESARNYYKKAIKGANANNYIQEEGLANELYAKFLFGMEEEDFAALKMRSAYHCYSLWGSTAKTDQMAKAHPALLKTLPEAATDDATDSTESSHTGLDMATIIKASQAITSEINLKKLLEKMTSVIMENAGAERGFILLHKNNELFIEASADTNKKEIHILESLKVGNNKDLSRGIANFVLRTGRSVIYPNDHEGDLFINDPYIKTNRPKSILCVPMRYMDKITGVLYLENNITTHAFTKERIETLNILQSQAAIAIENALVFEKLNAERDYSSSIIQNSPSLICGIDGKGTTTFINPTASEITGYSEEELIGKNWWKLFHPGEEHTQANRLLKELSAGEAVDYETTLTGKGGQKRDIVWNSFTKRDQSGSIFEIIRFGNDITDRKRYEKERARLTSILEATSDLVSLALPGHNIVYMNTSGKKMLGWPEDKDIREKKISDAHTAWAMQLIETEGIPCAIRDNIWAGETVVLSNDGAEIPVSQVIISHKNASGELEYISTIMRDITNRKKAEAELRRLRNYLSNIIDSMPSILIGVDTEGNVTQWNKKAEQTTGINAVSACGKSLLKVFPRMASQMDKIMDSIRSRQLIQDRKIPCPSENHTRYEDVAIYPLVINDVEGAVVRVDDVTRQVRMEQMMIQSEKMLSVGGLAAGMAHEINNPLAGLIQTANVMANRLYKNINGIPANLKAAETVGASLEAIRRYMTARDIPRMVDSITDSSQRVTAIVNNMLSFARKSEAQVSSHDIGGVIDNTLALASIEYDLKKHYDFKSIEIKKEYADNLPLVPCDKGMIQQVLLNILRNGAHAMLAAGTGDPRFIVRTARDDRGKMVNIEIEDNGPGMDEETRKRIFEPFFTTKPEGVGTGLGLSVSYFIITENHQGEMFVESHPGSGAKFSIRLPVEKA